MEQVVAVCLSLVGVPQPVLISLFQIPTLRDALRELLESKEAALKYVFKWCGRAVAHYRSRDVISQHEASVQELYGMLMRRHGEASSFPSIDEDEVKADVIDEEELNGWRDKYRLQAGPSRISSLQLPDLTPLSPPPTATVFPDEPPSESLAPIDIRPLIPETVDLNTVQRRSRQYAPATVFPPLEWVPLDNYKPATSPPDSPLGIPMPLESEYASHLPRLPALPKRNRKGSKSDQPKTDLFKLHVAYGLNPVSGALSKSSKCVLTADWRVAQQEMRLIRAMERIEAKKNAARWSLRQPKKHRGPAVPKAHWDWMLEEMEWMRVDFAEERRWKRVEAREFAYQVVEWHLSNPEGKRRLMVGHRGWGESTHLPIPGHSGRMVEDDIPEAEDVEMLIGEEATEELEDDAMDATGADVLETMVTDETVEDIEVKEEAVEDTIPVIAEGENDADGEADADAEGEADVDAEGEADANGEADAEGEAEPDAEGEVEVVVAEGDGAVGLEDIPAAPSTGTGEREREADSPDAGHRRASHGDHVLPNGMILNKRFSTAEQLLAARKPLLDLSLAATMVDISSLPALSTAIDSPKPDTAPETPPSLIDLFPDLGLYTGPQPPEDGKLHKRLDEGFTSGNRIAHTSRLMDLRPVFASTLKPAKNMHDLVWDLHDGPYWEDPKGSTDISPEIVAATSTFFSGRALRPLNAQPLHAPSAPSNQNMRPSPVWTTDEDKMLMKLIATYPFNWGLISDAFNSEKITIPTDKRSPWDCYDHWNHTWGPAKGAVRPEILPPQPPTQPPTPAVVPSSAASAITVPTLPNSAAGSSDLPFDGQNPPPPGLSKKERAVKSQKYEGSKKAIRHQVIYDAMKRMARRREVNKSKTQVKDMPKKVINVHESHSSYSMNQIQTPWDMAEQKYQRDVRNMQIRHERMQQEQQNRAQALRQQALNALGPGQAAAAAAAAAAQGQGTVPGQGQIRPPGPGQIRVGANGPPGPMPNMAPSQQQLLSAVVAANGARQNQPSNGPMVRPPGPPNAQQQQQIQMLQAQQMAASRAQQQAAGAGIGQVGRNGSPYNPPMSELSDSPQTQLSPSQRNGQIQSAVPQHMRSSPQLQAPMPAGSPVLNSATMQHILSTLAANGQQATPEQIRLLSISMVRQAQQAQAQAQAQAQQLPMQTQPVQFARSPNMQNAQLQPRNSPKP
ncbi:chromatin modification-related protein VID21, partial [Tremellales sp. Uapishka_1]